MDASRPLCLTICAYRAPGLSEDKYHDLYVNRHVPLVRDLLIKHGIKQYSMVPGPYLSPVYSFTDSWPQTHNAAASREQISQIRPQLVNTADYDSFIQIVFDDIQDFAKFEKDPEFIDKVAADHHNFHDAKRTRYVYPILQASFTHGPDCLLGSLSIL